MSIIKRGLFAFAVLFYCACTKPTDNLKLIVDTDLIKYTALIHITDAYNHISTPPGIILAVSGQNADDIYELSGKKTFTVVDGIITIGSGPSVTPTDSNPIKFNIVITANGYQTYTRAISFTPGQTQQVINVGMSKVGTAALPDQPTPVLPVTATPVTLNFTGTCSNNTNFEIRPSVYIFFKVTGSNAPFEYLGYMDKGSITTTALNVGEKYDFELTYGGKSYTVTQLVNQGVYNENIDMGDVCNTFNH